MECSDPQSYFSSSSGERECLYQILLKNPAHSTGDISLKSKKVDFMFEVHKMSGTIMSLAIIAIPTQHVDDTDIESVGQKTFIYLFVWKSPNFVGELAMLSQ